LALPSSLSLSLSLFRTYLPTENSKPWVLLRLSKSTEFRGRLNIQPPDLIIPPFHEHFSSDKASFITGRKSKVTIERTFLFSKAFYVLKEFSTHVHPPSLPTGSPHFWK
jgi:hypothetical protein